MVDEATSHATLGAPVGYRALSPGLGHLGGRLVVLAVILVSWQAAAVSGAINRLVLPPPTEVGQAWWDAARSGELIRDVSASVSRVGVGFGLACVVGIAVGILFGVFPPLQRQGGWIIETLRPIPPIAWIPLAILWFGIGDRPAVFIVFLGAFFPIVTATYLGIAAVSRSVVDSARSLGASWLLVVTDVLVPAAIPTIVIGLRTGLGVGWMSVIAAELVGAGSGLGYRIQLGQVLLRSDSIIATMLTIGVVGIATQTLLTLAVRVLLPQHHRRLRRTVPA